MGSYTDKLFKNKRRLKVKPEHYIVDCAIRRGGVEHSGFRTHADLRRELGDKNPYMKKTDDVEGFMDNTGSFCDRDTARRIAVEAGQCMPMRRELLSSDIEEWF